MTRKVTRHRSEGQIILCIILYNEKKTSTKKTAAAMLYITYISAAVCSR